MHAKRQTYRIKNLLQIGHPFDTWVSSLWWNSLFSVCLAYILHSFSWTFFHHSRFGFHSSPRFNLVKDFLSMTPISKSWVFTRQLLALNPSVILFSTKTPSYWNIRFCPCHANSTSLCVIKPDSHTTSTLPSSSADEPPISFILEVWHFAISL